MQQNVTIMIKKYLSKCDFPGNDFSQQWLSIYSGSKIIRAFEVIRVEKLKLNAVLWKKYLSSRDL